MEVPITTFVDSHSGQQISHSNPMEKNRRPTNSLSIFVFILIVIAWLGLCISAFSGDRGPNSIHDKYAAMIIRFDSYMDMLYLRYSTVIIISLVLGTLGTLFCIFLNSKITSFSIYLGLVLAILSTIVSIIKCSFYIKLSFFYCLQLIVLIICIISLLKIDKSILFDVIRDTCRTVIYNPPIILFICLISILEISVFLLTWKALIQYLLDSRGECFMPFVYVIMIACGICVVSFLLNFAIMVISDYTVNYYWKNASITHTLGRVLRNHMGTVIFSSMPVIPFICTLVQAWKHMRSRKNKENYFFYYASKLFLVLTMPWAALTFCSIYGTGFVKSTQKTFDTLLRRCLLYLATIGAVHALFATDTVGMCIFVLSGQSIFREKTQANDTSDSATEATLIVYLILIVMTYPILTFALALYSSAEALLVNKMIMLNKEDQFAEGKNEILNRL